MVNVGDIAPDFELVDTELKMRKLEEFAGKNVVNTQYDTIKPVNWDNNAHQFYFDGIHVAETRLIYQKRLTLVHHMRQVSHMQAKRYI